MKIRREGAVVADADGEEDTDDDDGNEDDEKQATSPISTNSTLPYISPSK